MLAPAEAYKSRLLSKSCFRTSSSSPALRLGHCFSTHPFTLISQRRSNSGEKDPDLDKEDQLVSSWSDEVVVYGAALFLTSSSFTIYYLFRDPFEDLLYGGYLTNLLGCQISLGDIFALVLWTVAYYFISPLQILFLFLGRFETARPSDWILYQLGRFLNKPVDEANYEPSTLLYGVMFAIVLTTAFLTMITIGVLVGGATWSVSTGIGACIAAGFFEIGRPTRLNVQEKQQLDQQFADFVSFAEKFLQKTGSCHESEVFQKFRKEIPKYQDEELLSDLNLRRFIKEWAPRSGRTSNGFFKSISLRTQSMEIL